VPVETVVRFITDHLFGFEDADAEAVMTAPRDDAPTHQGRTPIKAKAGAHKLSTIRRRLSSLSAWAVSRGVVSET